MFPLPPISTLFPYTTLFRSADLGRDRVQRRRRCGDAHLVRRPPGRPPGGPRAPLWPPPRREPRSPRGVGDPAHRRGGGERRDRKSTRLNSSHRCISYAVFCLNVPAPPDIYTLSLHDALPIC